MEQAIVTGNTFDKYNTRNPIYKRLMDNFLDKFIGLVDDSGGPLRVLEVGCGEGLLAAEVFARRAVASYQGFDLEERLVGLAGANCPGGSFATGSAYDLSPYLGQRFDYVIVSEVMEHLEQPHRALAQLCRLDAGRFLFSVPSEPVWRVLNVARLKYLAELGNTPGHLQHWSRRHFGRLLARHFELERLTGSFPWTIALCRP